MNKRILILMCALVSGSLFLSQAVSAHQLEKDMHVLAKTMTAFAQTDDLAEANKQLVLMRKAAVSSKASLPHQLEGLTPENDQVKSYQGGLDQLIAEIDAVTALVEKGQLEDAKVEALKLVKLRNEYHQQFK
ncbi:MAG: cytochrome b562 [Acinetobacter venetianus]|uniref:cytochrome b562 n=1 Tax=Acinetobacter venetianus TaxID=52133 RepID=UPI003C78E153